MNETSSFRSRRLWLQTLGASVCGALVCTLPGCSLGVMFGKMLSGEPKIPAEFKARTREDLVKGKHTVLVVCSAPESIESDQSTLKFDLIDGITRRMKLNGVNVINPDQVASWIDEHGGMGANPSELANDFDADYIIWVDLQTFSFREPNSQKLLRGQSSGFVRVFRVDEAGGQRMASNVYTTEFTSTYPTYQPISEQGRSALIFQKEYLDRICDQLAQKFYDHRPGTDI